MKKISGVANFDLSRVLLVLKMRASYSDGTIFSNDSTNSGFKVVSSINHRLFVIIAWEALRRQSTSSTFFALSGLRFDSLKLALIGALIATGAYVD